MASHTIYWGYLSQVDASSFETFWSGALRGAGGSLHLTVGRTGMRSGVFVLLVAAALRILPDFAALCRPKLLVSLKSVDDKRLDLRIGVRIPASQPRLSTGRGSAALIRGRSRPADHTLQIRLFPANVLKLLWA